MLRTAVYRSVLARTAATPTRTATSAAPLLRLTLTKQSAHSGADQHALFLRAMQTQLFATLPTKDESSPGVVSPRKTFEELLEENAALRKQVADLEGKVKNKPGKFMAVISQFGMPFLVWWTTLYIGTGAALYIAFDTGLIAGADAIKFIMDMGLDKFIDINTINPTYGNMALAALLNEFLEPLRFPFALATIPAVKRVFAKKQAATEELKQ